MVAKAVIDPVARVHVRHPVQGDVHQPPADDAADEPEDRHVQNRLEGQAVAVRVGFAAPQGEQKADHQQDAPRMHGKRTDVKEYRVHYSPCVLSGKRGAAVAGTALAGTVVLIAIGASCVFSVR